MGLIHLGTDTHGTFNSIKKVSHVSTFSLNSAFDTLKKHNVGYELMK